MAKQYWLKFGNGDPRTNTGLTPTFIIFQDTAGAAVASPPGVTEPGSGTGLYRFEYGVTASIVFTADGGSGLADADRYVTGVLDPVQAVDEKVGTTESSFGSTSADPSTLMGFAKRNQEFQEGDATFTKATGKWQINSRGASTLLREKTLANSTTSATKT